MCCREFKKKDDLIRLSKEKVDTEKILDIKNFNNLKQSK